MSGQEQNEHETHWRGLLDYLEGRLPEAERAALEARLETDAWDMGALEALERHAERHGMAQTQAEVADFEQRFLGKVHAMAKADEARVPEMPQLAPARSRFRWTRLAAALVVLLAVGAVLWVALLQQANFVPYQFETTRGAAASKAAVDRGLEEYKAGAWANAIAAFEEVPEGDARYELALFALANAYAANGQPKEAIAAFNQMLANPDWQLYRADAEASLKTLE